MNPFQRKILLGALVLLIPGLPVLAGSFNGATPAPPNVLLIVLDTTRQDRLSLYGYGRKTSPNLESLAADSRVYQNAYSTSTWTAASHASLFTGLFPIAHHCTQERWKLAENLDTLAELLSAAGYQTIGISENPVLSRKNRFDQGFDEYHEMWQQPATSPGADAMSTVRLLDKFLNQREAQRPFFTFVNLIGAHSPYDSSGEFRETFLTNPGLALKKNHWRQFYLGDKTFAGPELRHLSELYDAELLKLDQIVGEMIDTLRRHDLLENTLVVITSDHGENLGEHGHLDHVFSLYETTLRVPLIIRFPAQFPAGSIHQGPVQLVDIVPTILDLAHIQASGPPLQGRSLLAAGEAADRAVFCEYYRPVQVRRALKGAPRKKIELALRPYDRRIRSILQDGMKLIWGSDERHELYDLRSDPGENHDLIDQPEFSATRDRLIKALMAMVGQSMREDPIAAGEPDAGMDPATVEALRALGYLE